MFKAEIIADSINEKGNRLTTFVVVFPRIVLAEFNTHRQFSRNSSSSRAIPFEKMVSMVRETPFIPIRWMKDHKGMQGTEYITNQICIDYCVENWLNARDMAIQSATRLSRNEVTKQVCNRLLEPFMWHTVIVTATDYENFFALRVHEAAEIHIQKIAGMMLEEYNKSTPNLLKEGQWHIPFGDKFDEDRLEEINKTRESLEILKVKIATARCARVSYLNFEGKDDYLKDLELHNSLVSSAHFSPTEHCAYSSPGVVSGNFTGFIQYRKTLYNENRHDNRVVKHIIGDYAE